MRRIWLASATILLTSLAIAATGGPDNAGYNWIDSDTGLGPSHLVLDIDGDDLDLGDEDTGIVELPFDFTWYGGTETTLEATARLRFRHF